jgi:hypothetical protein
MDLGYLSSGEVECHFKTSRVKLNITLQVEHNNNENEKDRINGAEAKSKC